METYFDVTWEEGEPPKRQIFEARKSYSLSYSWLRYWMRAKQ